MIRLNRGDKVAIVSLSAGTLGEDFCKHQLERGRERLESFGFEVVEMPNALKGIDFIRENPQKRAEDLVAAFSHILAEVAFEYQPSDTWFEEREDFSEAAIGTERLAHKEVHGYQLLQGSAAFSGTLIGGCVESLYDLLAGERYPEEKLINDQYKIFPSKSQLDGAIVFLETPEEKPTPETLRTMLLRLKEEGLFDGIKGVLFGKPQNEVYFEEYKAVLCDVLARDIPILYNLNFGHAYPKMLMQYGALATVDAEKQSLKIERL